MSDNPVKIIPMLPCLRYAAVQRMLGTTGMALLPDSQGRSMPAKIYQAFKDAENWVVEPPANDVLAAVEPKTFTGRTALFQALEYAHYNYGSVLYFSS